MHYDSEGSSGMRTENINANGDWNTVNDSFFQPANFGGQNLEHLFGSDVLCGRLTGKR